VDTERSDPAVVPSELERRVLRQTGWRVSNLSIQWDEGRLVLRGRATTPRARQLAQQAAQDLLPDLRLDNGISVDCDEEVLTGMPLH
jgi:hypothetical protein